MEQKAAHTPGPWFVAPSGTTVHDKRVWFDEHGARCGDTPNICIDAETPANARLIAAAPELLAALETAYMALIGYLPAHRNDVTDAAIGAARAAIAKATRRNSND